MNLVSRMFATPADAISDGLRYPLASLPFVGLAVGLYSAYQNPPSFRDFGPLPSDILSGKVGPNLYLTEHSILGDAQAGATAAIQNLSAEYSSMISNGAIVGFLIGAALMFIAFGFAARRSA